jgi:hypothetical protein
MLIAKMTTNGIIHALDAEMLRLQQVRALLAAVPPLRKNTFCPKQHGQRSQRDRKTVGQGKEGLSRALWRVRKAGRSSEIRKHADAKNGLRTYICISNDCERLFDREIMGTTPFAADNSPNREWRFALTAGPFVFSAIILLVRVSTGSASVNGSQMRTNPFKPWILKVFPRQKKHLTQTDVPV